MTIFIINKDYNHKKNKLKDGQMGKLSYYEDIYCSTKSSQKYQQSIGHPVLYLGFSIGTCWAVCR